jgi:hypothetical protein
LGQWIYCSGRTWAFGREPAGRAMESSGQTPGPSPSDAQPPGGGHDYPLTFSVDYPDRELPPSTVAARIAIGMTHTGSGARFAGGGIGVLFLPVVLMLLFRKKYPRWWYDWNLQLSRFSNRIAVYFALMDDRYPPTDEQQAVHLDFPYPDAEQLSRGFPLVEWLLAIPLNIALSFLTIGSLFAAVGAWFAILFTVRYPRGLFDYIESVIRWHNRVGAYALLLITDRYPPFSLQP